RGRKAGEEGQPVLPPVEARRRAEARLHSQGAAEPGRLVRRARSRDAAVDLLKGHEVGVERCDRGPNGVQSLETGVADVVRGDAHLGVDGMREVGFVLHKPRIADNVGGVARAMANFGFSRLILASPATWHFDPRTAVRAEHVLENAYMALTLDEAVAPFAWVCGTTRRTIRRRPALSPRELGAEVARRIAAGGTVAIVFGSENHGLTNEDLERCDAICRIDTAGGQPSINLAQ